MEHIFEACIGAYFLDKWQKRAKAFGHRKTAEAMRKAGIPLEMALLILFGEAS
jgi:hypothetical protein